jgi:glycosyltransferase involved in cell wall biosynthesis
MNVLMIGFDRTVLADEPVPGDARERHIKYAHYLRQRFPTGKLSFVVRVPVSNGSQPRELSEGFTVYPVPCRRAEFALRARAVLKRLLNEERYDLITTQTPFDDGWLGVWAQRNFDVALNVQMRSSFLDMVPWIRERPILYRAFNALGKWVATNADTIRVVSLGEKDRLERLFPQWKGKITALHPLVNFRTFSQPVSDEERLRVRRILERFKIAEVPFFLFVGRFVAQKNLTTLLEAFAQLQKESHPSALVLAGAGPLRPRIERLIKDLQVEDRVVWLGNVPLKELRGWYASAQATILPSFHEGFGKVIVESYLMGTPVIATPFVSAPELVKDQETGFITSSFTDSRELAEKMRILLESPELVERMGKQGKDHVQRYLLPEEAYMQELITLWERTAAARSGR